MRLTASGRHVESPGRRLADEVAVGLERYAVLVEGADRHRPGVDPARTRQGTKGPPGGLEREARRRAGIDPQRQATRVRPRAGIHPEPATVVRRRADHDELGRAAVHRPAVGRHLDP